MAAPAPRRGFTFVEMMIVVFVLTLMSAMVMPHLVQARVSANQRAFEDRLSALVGSARREAVRRKEPVHVRVSDEEFQVVTGTGEGEDSVVSREPLPEGMTLGALNTRGEEASESDWSLTCYPDGRAHAAAVEVSASGRARTLDVTPDGRARWRDGAAGDKVEETWEAGALEQRTG